MIYIIGGSPRCGKSKLAKKLSKKLKIPVFSTDQLRKAVIKSTAVNKIDIRFPLERMFRGDKIDDFFANHSAKDILNADKREARTLRNIIKCLLISKLENEQDFIIEGVHLLPKYIAQLSNYKTKMNILYIGKLDVHKIYKGLKQNFSKDDWIIGHIKNKDSLNKAAEMVELYSKYFFKEAKKYNFKFINTEKQFYQQLKNALKNMALKK